MSLQGKEEARRLLWAALADESYAVGEGRSMKNEYTPLTDKEVELLTWAAGHPETERVAKDLKEARRLLRAVEWGGIDHTCPFCEVMDGGGHTPMCELGRYLAACEGKEQP